MKIGTEIIFLGKQWAAAAIIIIVAAACECIPGIDTEKKFSPDEASKVYFINAMPDIENIDLITDVVTISNQKYSEKSGEYKLIGTGKNNVRFQIPDSEYPFFNSLSEFKKDRNYTLIGYGPGSGRKIRMLIIEDQVEGFQETKSYLRFLHVMTNHPGESPLLLFILKKNTPEYRLLKYTSFSSFDEIEPGTYTIDILNKANDSLLTSTETTLEPGRIYTMTAKGYFSGTGVSAPRFMLHSVPVETGK